MNMSHKLDVDMSETDQLCKRLDNSTVANMKIINWCLEVCGCPSQDITSQLTKSPTQKKVINGHKRCPFHYFIPLSFDRSSRRINSLDYSNHFLFKE